MNYDLAKTKAREELANLYRYAEQYTNEGKDDAVRHVIERIKYTIRFI